MSKQCEGCAYAVLLSHDWCCDYLSLTGHRRPCPPGEACTVRKEAERDPKRVWKENKPMKAQIWDTEKARALYDKGLSDERIAAALGIARGTVYKWRRNQGLSPRDGGVYLERPSEKFIEGRLPFLPRLFERRQRHQCPVRQVGKCYKKELNL